MSVIYITNHDEVIYDVVKPAERIYKKSPRYKSALKSKFKFDDNANKKAYATMGPARVPLPEPSNFLRKHSKKFVRKEVEMSPRPCRKQNKRPPVPSFKEMIKDEKSRLEEKPKKNFIQKNVININKKKPPELQPKFVDKRTGDIQHVDKSGLEPYYIYKDTYGKPPNYLMRRINKAITKTELEKDKTTEDKSFSNCRYITRQDRQELLNGLKQNWDEMQKQYQLLPIITDTIPKIVRKTKLEKDLKQLEKDISLIESHPFIYVYN